MGKKTSFIADDQINSIVNDLVVHATEKLMLVSPWFELNTHLMDKVLDALKSEVEIFVLTRPETENEKHRAALAELRRRGAEIHIDPFLHAKFVIADDSYLLMFSSNLIQTSLGRNHECGIATEESEIIEDAANYAIQIAERHESPAKSNHPQAVIKERAKAESGHCICCNIPIALDVTLYKIRCKECFKEGNEFGKYCHGCGASKPVSLEKPFCNDCWKKMK